MNFKDMGKGKRIAVIDYDKCHPEKCNSLCGKICPINKMGKECIEGNPPIIHEELCIGCGICVHRCPFQAIKIVNISPKLKQPLHSYGQNRFRVFGFPLVRKGVLGLIGRNGIGKTTILNILAGNIVPNLGEEKGDYDKVIDFFKGKEIQEYFKKLKNKEIKLSLKPQHIDYIPKIYKGKVKDLFAKTFGEKAMEVLKEFEIEHLEEREIKELSGGELQKIAIAVAYKKEAEIYFFDEPTSYLDIKERLKIAKKIRILGEEKNIVAVEHDLAILDYLSDYIHVLYGEKGVYGVVSSPKTTRNGINEFLEGYLTDENMRFRNYELKFYIRSSDKTEKIEKALEYPNLSKKLGSFELEIKGDVLNKGEIIGVLGGNGTGKTTFVRILAGEIKPDNCKYSPNLKLSYKEQYLKAKDILVSEFFEDIDKEFFKAEIDKRLEVSSLFEKKMDKLSGGELQKVLVAKALCKEADVYLLDEPTAFIDVEDRLNIADCVRSTIEKRNAVGIVIDHDLMFQDYVSDRILVFEGQGGKKGKAGKIDKIEEGMNKFLAGMGVTFRRDQNTKRIRANKPGSQKDSEQKKEGKYYYVL